MKKSNKKGFTLIELLAVIIILAIIALIAVPTIMTIIDNSKKSAAADSTYGVMSAAELWYSNYLLQSGGTSFSGNATFTCDTGGCKATVDGSQQTLSIKGEVPSEGTVTVQNDGKVISAVNLKFNNFYCQYNENSQGTKATATCDKNKVDTTDK